MLEQVNIKRQVRYKDSIYDILKDITLGERHYLIIGKGSDSKFFDIDFVEQKIDNGKVKYVSPSSSYQFNSELTDFGRIQSQALMSYIVNEIKDNINQERLRDSDDTIRYIDEIAKITDSNNDIKGFFVNNNSYNSEEELENSIKTLIGYYEKEIKGYDDDNKRLPAGEVLVSDETVKEIYGELENTGNFGVSLISDMSRVNGSKEDDYIVDPTNSIFIDNSSDIQEQSTFEPTTEKNNEKTVSNGIASTEIPVEEQLVIDNEQPIMRTNIANMSFQERLYLENEKKLHEKEQRDLQTEIDVKTKTLTLNSNSMRRHNAAYVSISLLLYLIGSFELLLSIILLVKYL